MKFLSGCNNYCGIATKAAACAFAFAMLFNSPVAASEKLTDTNVTAFGENALVLFPTHDITDFKVVSETPEVVQADLYDFTFDTSNKLVPSPHPKIKFMRLNQVSSSPDIVRATLVFNEPVKVEARRAGRNLLIETTRSTFPKKKQETAEQIIAKQAPAMKSSLDAPSDAGNKFAPSDAGNMFAPQNAYAAKPSNSKTVLDQKVSLNFEQEDLMTILNALAAKFDLRVFADAGVKGKMSVNAQDITLREILKNLLLQRNFQYTLKGRDLTVISFGNDSTRMARELLFRDLSLKDALQTLSKMMDINLIIHESVEDKKVNFYVENLSLDELLDLLIDTNGLVKKPYNDNTYVILAKENYSDFGEKQYRTFKLVNAKPDEVVNMIRSSKSLSEKINTENFSLNERINTISVYDIPENLSLIEKIIDSVDEKLKQAVIEVKLIEINHNDAKELGLLLDSYSVKVFDGKKVPSFLGAAGAGTPIAAQLDLLERNNKIKVLSSPKIRAVHGKKASISIGKVYPIPYYRYENASNTYWGYQPDKIKEYRDVETGIKLSVTPEISRDNEISLDINTTIDDMLGEANDDGQYKRSQRTTNTYVRVKNGETVVMGGLINNQTDEVKQSPSLLNKIPLLKTLTSHNSTTTTSQELIILVTPRLVNLDGEEREDLSRYGVTD